ncbi:MAG: septum formation initiator family protein, partial [Bacteroidia bacterium]|nr:septum formation initiator family protein [Bacteroidia bacterium]MBP7262459.1 septum formation initiator family protein [Bacteroidia bacterium]
IEQAKKERDQLFTNEEALEKFAREKYHMKKDNEEVFIIVDEKEKE